MTGDLAETGPAGPRAFGNAARLFVCLILLCGMNAAFWAPSLASVLAGFLSDPAAPDFANRDFANYWLSGRLAIGGDVSALGAQASHQAALEAAFGLGGMEPRSWSYPPHFLLVTWPLGLLSYPLAYALFMAVTGGWFIWTVWVWTRAAAKDNARLVFAAALALLMPFVCLQVFAGQNGFFFGAAMLQALFWRKSRPIAAGLMLAVLTMKPQLGLLLPILLLMERRFATIAWAAVFTALLTGLSALIFGGGIWSDFFGSTLPYQQYVAAQWSGQFLYMIPTWFAAMRAAGLAYEPALAVHLCIALPLVLAGLVALVRAADDLSRSRLVLAATFVLTPYAFNYDLGALLVLAGLGIAVSAAKRPIGWVESVAGALVMALPLWTPLLGRPDAILLLPPLVVSGLMVHWAAPHLARIWRPLASPGASVS